VWEIFLDWLWSLLPSRQSAARSFDDDLDEDDEEDDDDEETHF